MDALDCGMRNSGAVRLSRSLGVSLPTLEDHTRSLLLPMITGHHPLLRDIPREDKAVEINECTWKKSIMVAMSA